MKNLIFLIIFLSLSLSSFSQTEVTTDDKNFRGSKLYPEMTYSGPNDEYYYDDGLLKFGFYGATIISTTTTEVGSFYAFQILENAVIDSLVGPDLDGDTPNGLTLISGLVIYGKFTRIKLTSGKIIAYKME